MDFRTISIEALVDDVRAKRISAEEVARHAAARIEARNPELNAFCAVDLDAAVDQAKAIDARIAAGEDVGPLAGIPVGVKDLEDAKGFTTTYGSALWGDAPAATGDSIAVARMRAAGAVIMGKTNTPEFGCKGATDNPLFGQTKNPWNPDYSPGGSSGGSGAALAAGMVPLTTGSDGGGSIRIPAALCGLSGIKASQGRVPLGGEGPATTGLLAVRGPMATGIRDTVIALDAIRGDERTDTFGLPADDGPWLPRLDGRAPAKVIWAPTLGYAEIDANVLEVCEAAVQRLADAGAEVIHREALLSEHPLNHWWCMWSSAMARKLGDRQGTADWDRIDPDLRVMVEQGLTMSGADYARAIDAGHRYNYELEAAFGDAPIILSPTCAGRTPRNGELGSINGRDTAGWVEMTFGFNISRNPAATVHAGLNADGLPVGLQLIGPQRDDLGVLNATLWAEEVLGRADLSAL